MTPHEIELARALGDCCGWVGSRFMLKMSMTANQQPNTELTLRQRYYMEILAWRYRRQLPASMVPHAKPLPLPRARKEPKPKKQPKHVELALREPGLFGDC